MPTVLRRFWRRISGKSPCWTPGTIPVSYTHLDVYKRQAGSYPYNLGEGKLAGAQENNIYYYLGCAYEGADQPDKAAACFQKASVGISEPAGMMYYNDQPPEMIFYQGMALRKLNREKEARSRFHKLLDYGQKHIFDDVKIDYFAVSLPDLQIFDEDLNRKNEIHCRFLMGLGLLGLGQEKEACLLYTSFRCYTTNRSQGLLWQRIFGI